MTQQQNSSIGLVDRYNQVRGQIQHEDNLITQRLSWFLTSQSFLFTAYAILISSPPRMALLLKVIPLIAIIAGALISLSIFAGLKVMRDLRRGFSPWLDAARETGLPALQGTCGTRFLGMLAPVLLPPTFMVAWIVLIVRGG